MLNLNEIIEERVDMDNIKDLYINDKISRVEFLLLSATKNPIYLKRFLFGEGEYRVEYDSTVDRNLYFVNIPAVLKAFYICYEKYPKYHFDKILSTLFMELSNDDIKLYKFLNVLSVQLDNEVKGISPFKIVSVEMLENCKKNLTKLKDIYKDIHDYEATNRKNGYMDVISDLNENFKRNLNYDILEENGSKFLI